MFEMISCWRSRPLPWPEETRFAGSVSLSHHQIRFLVLLAPKRACRSGSAPSLLGCVVHPPAITRRTSLLMELDPRQGPLPIAFVPFRIIRTKTLLGYYDAVLLIAEDIRIKEFLYKEKIRINLVLSYIISSILLINYTQSPRKCMVIFLIHFELKTFSC